MKGITKGEWVSNPNGLNKYQVWCNDTKIAACDNFVQSEIYRQKTDEEMEANGRLICTAGNLTNAGYNIEAMPQLVEALEWSLKEFTKLADDGKYPEHLMVSNGGNGLMPIINALKSAKL